jgi:DHA2 family multidrug resistance protein-like MFS transporter
MKILGPSTGAGRWWALGALVLSTLVLGLDITILVTALPTLSSALGATTDQLQWILAAYTLALAGFLLPAGVLADRYGRKRLLIVGLVLFGVSSVLASRVTSAEGLILMRALMGLGGAIILPISLAILPSLFDERERPRAIAFAGAGAFLGLPLGPLVAGWLLTHFAWGSVFLINAPVVVLALLGVWLLVPESRDSAAPRLDWIGAALEVVGVTSVVYGIIEQPGNGWTDQRVLVALVGGALLLAAFVAWELRTRAPLIDLRLFRNARFAWATAAFVAVGFAMNGVLFVLTPYLQVVQGTDAQATGVRLLPLIGAMLAGALASARLAGRFGTKAMLAGGFFVTSLGLLLLSRAGGGSGFALIAVAEAVIGLGIAVAMVPSLDAILGALPANETGAGSAFTRMLQNVAASFGVAIMGSLLNGAYRSRLTGDVSGLPAPARSAAEGSVAGAVAVAHRLPPGLGKPLIAAAGDAYAAGMADVMLLSAAVLLALAVLVAIFLPRRAVVAESSPAPLAA